MRTAILNSPEQLFALEPQWEELHRRTAGPVSMSPTWLFTWWKVFGSRFGMRVLAGWAGDDLVGLFPCFIESFSLLRMRARRLRFLGEYSILAEYHPLVDPRYAVEFVAGSVDFCLGLLKAGECDLIDFHAFPYEDPFMQQWIESMKHVPVLMSVRDREVPRIRIDLPGTMKEYWKLLSSNERAHLRRKERILKAAGARFECVNDPADTEAFRDYVRLNTTLWEQKGAGSYFTSREGFQRFQEEVTAAFLQRGAARLYFLEQGGYRFAALHAYVMNGVVQMYLGGRDPAHPLSRWSPGLILMVHAIGEAIAGGAKEFDFLTGNHSYKHNLGGTVHGWHGRVIAALRSPRGWKGVMMIAAHSVMVAVGKSPRLRWVEKQFNRLSAGLRGGEIRRGG